MSTTTSTSSAGPPPQDGTAPVVLDLGDERARDRDLTGGKAASLAAAAAEGCQTVAGFVLTVTGVSRIDEEGLEAVTQPLDAAFDRLTADGGAVVARSSSVVEDGAEKSMAGRYETVLGITNHTALHAAVSCVMQSRRDVARTNADLSASHPIAVLVQREIDPDWGGVAFGVDPSTGRPDRRSISATAGTPDDLVSGEIDGDTWVLGEDGSIVRRPQDPATGVEEDLLHRIADLVDQVGEIFGGPQDVEWAADRDGTLRLLQSRPVTTDITGVPTGPEYGTGPIAETFPDAMTALEEDLWVPPLRDALRHALSLAAVAGSDQIEDSEVLITLQGRAAIDLELLGRSDRNTSPVKDRARRMLASWRLGRLRSALPRAARRIVARTDEELLAVEALDAHSDRQLLRLLDRAQDVLGSLHGHEVLMGMVMDPDEQALTGNGVAIRALAAARREGLTDDAAVRRDPSILSLAPPRIGRGLDLPELADVPDRPASPVPPMDPAVLREALRMRVRWVQELTVRVVHNLAGRLVTEGLLEELAAVRHLRLESLHDLVVEGGSPSRGRPPSGQPLPTRFRLTADRTIVPSPVGDDTDGVGAGGGSATGAVHVLSDDPDFEDVPDDSVLLVDTLIPGLVGVLDRIAGLVAETGSPLSHVAILARESGVATVVGLAGVRDRFSEGQRVRVDGTNGSVILEEDA